MRLVPMFDNGHGGMINGIYQTAGKRSPKWSKGVLGEGMFNRWVVNRIIEKLDREKIPYFHLSPELSDVSLSTRVKRADAIQSKTKNVYVLSIHANAGGGVGIEGFTTVGLTGSDEVGEVILKNLEIDLKPYTNMRFDMRSDGDRDKEKNYYLLRKPRARAFLLECGFMDSVQDYNNLWDTEYLEVLTSSIAKSIIYMYNQ